MKTYVIYDDNGMILQNITMPEGDKIYYSSNIIESDCDIYTNFVLNGVLTPFPAKPNDACKWDWNSKSWVFSPAMFDDLKHASINKVNAKAGEIITARLPIWKQSNMTARAVELQAIKPNWTTAEQAEWDHLQSQWDWVKSVRVASNAAVDAINAAETPDDVYAIVNGFGA